MSILDPRFVWATLRDAKPGKYLVLTACQHDDINHLIVRRGQYLGLFSFSASLWPGKIEAPYQSSRKDKAGIVLVITEFHFPTHVEIRGSNGPEEIMEIIQEEFNPENKDANQ